MPSESSNYVERQQYKLYFKNILRKVFLEDWLMKLVALIITFALWVGVTGLSKPTQQRMSGIPLTLRFSNNTEVTNSPIQEVDIVISGDKRKIDQINKNDLIMSLDLTDVQPGDRVIQLTPENVYISLPTGIKLDEIQPRRIAIKLEAIEEKEIPVNAATNGEIDEGLEIYSETITPQKVRVRGPASFIKSLTSVTTDKIDLTNKGADFIAKQVSVNVSNPKATLLDTVVDVAFRIGEKRIEKSFVVAAKDDTKRKVTVVLFGGKSLFDGIKAEDLHVEFVKNTADEDVPQITLPASLQNKVEVRKPKAGR
ncbi:MAG: CdaR family protein [Pyrinomonadaceae bacterium]